MLKIVSLLSTIRFVLIVAVVVLLSLHCSRTFIIHAYQHDDDTTPKRLLSSPNRPLVLACSISDAYDGGNIQHVRSNGTTMYLRIQSDPFTQLEQKRHMQYFSFRCICSANNTNTSTVTFEIINAKDCSYPKAWPGTTVFVSSNLLLSGWTRVQSTYYDSNTGHLVWSYNLPPSSATGSSSVVYFSYFPPYSYERHLQLISAASTSVAAAQVKTLGQTFEGREIDLITVGNGPRIAWIIHRQHPGETMAEYYAEGLLDRLLSLSSLGLNQQKSKKANTYNNNNNNNNNDDDVDDVQRAALEMFTFYIVPNMCPDGSVHGYLRTNAKGANLNREWASTGEYQAPTLERSPEVFHVLHEMDKTGVDVFVDVHGDESLPFNFIVGNEGLWDTRLQALHGAFVGAYVRANSDMQKHVAYRPSNNKKKINLAVASRQIAYRFDCLSVTLEMPFKDCLSNPDPTYGWSPDRAKTLGASLLDALVYVQPYLRADGVSAETFPLKDDAYVLPTDQYESYFNTSTKFNPRSKTITGGG